MNSGRRYFRTTLERACHLIGRDGENYSTSLVNISLSGALVKVDTKPQFKIGDLCDFMLSLKTAEVPVKRTCKIMRLDNEFIGVMFLTLNPAIPPARLLR